VSLGGPVSPSPFQSVSSRRARDHWLGMRSWQDGTEIG